MAGPVFANNAVGTLAAAYAAGATAITLTAGQGARFPSPAAGEWFPVTVVDAANNLEIMRCTARVADTLTVVRGQESTAARSWAAGDKAEHRLTAAALIAIRDRPLDTSQIPDGSITSSKLGAQAVTTPAYALGSISGPQIADGAIGYQKLAAGAAITNLGYYPVQQGGGVGMSGNKVYIGWSEPWLRASVDVADYGYLLPLRHDGTANTGGYRGVPAKPMNANYTMGLADAGCNIVHASSDPHTYVLPSNAVPFGDGTIIKISNVGVGPLTVVPAGGISLWMCPGGATGARTVAQFGFVIAEKFGDWFIHGPGLS